MHELGATANVSVGSDPQRGEVLICRGISDDGSVATGAVYSRAWLPQTWQPGTWDTRAWGPTTWVCPPGSRVLLTPQARSECCYHHTFLDTVFVRSSLVGVK